MVFVGRERETARIAAALSRKRNIVVSGKVGVGRTALVKHTAEVMGDAWRFVFLDFSRSPAQVCLDMLQRLEPVGASVSGRSKPSFKSVRARILHVAPPDRRQWVLVLDGAYKLTGPRMDLLRQLASLRRYLLVVITDNHIREVDLLQLRASLYPASVVTVSNLPRRYAREFFARVSAGLDLGWGEGAIAGLASASGGYPLLMAEAAARVAGRRAGCRDDCPWSRVDGPATAPARRVRSGSSQG